MDDKELRSDLRMDAYYYGFNETGVIEIDRILSSVAIAGKAYHHTEGWSDHNDPWRTWQRGKSHVGFIQNAAIDAAARITALAEENERLKAVFAAAQDQMDAYDRIKRAGAYSWIGPTLEYDKAAIKTNEAVRAALSEVPR